MTDGTRRAIFACWAAAFLAVAIVIGPSAVGLALMFIIVVAATAFGMYDRGGR